MNLNGLFNALGNATTLSEAIGVAGTLQGALGTNTVVAAQANGFLNQYQLAQAQNNAAAMAAAATGLMGIADKLPASDIPQIEQLGNPAVMGSPAVAAGLIGQIEQSFLKSSFL
jgi:hypothetical protein